MGLDLIHNDRAVTSLKFYWDSSWLKSIRINLSRNKIRLGEYSGIISKSFPLHLRHIYPSNIVQHRCQFTMSVRVDRCSL